MSASCVFVLLGLLASTAYCETALRLNGVTYNGVLRDENKVKFYAFYGIPYARQPVERFRYTMPKPMNEINDWKLTEEEKSKYYTTPKTSPNTCPQIDPFTNQYDTASIEDCLRIDIYITEKFWRNENQQPTGMIVLLDGIDFKSSLSHKIAPSLGFFEQSDQTGVLAVVHYRTGSLGFLTTEDEQGPANLGLWDQHEALKFLKNNAATFRVNPARIGLVGFGSGGISASIHTLNSHNQGLFKSVLISGGSALSPDANIQHGKIRALKFGEEVGCTSSSSSRLIQCFRDVEIRRLVSAAAKAQYLFGPTVDRNHTNDINKAYITDFPEKLMRTANFDWIREAVYGYPENAASFRYYSAANSDELKVVVHSAVQNPQSVDDRIKKYLSPYQRYTDTTTAISASTKFLYFRNYTDEQVMANQTLFDELMIQALTDYTTFGPVISAAHIHARRKPDKEHTGVRIYVRTADRNAPSLSDKMAAMTSALIKPATVMDDIIQFVGINDISVPASTNDRQLITFWKTVAEAFGSEDGRGYKVSGIHEYNPESTTPRTEYITLLTKDGPGQTMSTPFREPNRVFWSKYIPNIQDMLDDISMKSVERHNKANTYSFVSIGTGVGVGVLLLISIVLGFLLFREKRSGASKMPNVSFRQVAQSDA